MGSRPECGHSRPTGNRFSVAKAQVGPKSGIPAKSVPEMRRELHARNEEGPHAGTGEAAARRDGGSGRMPGWGAARRD
ncbi:hypothetical protein GCM10027089_07300 [Nocardia thraciensis]